MVALTGGKKGGNSAPTPPDPAVTIAAQQAASRQAVLESARINQINQVTPQGSTTFTGQIGTPGRTQTLTLPPAAQAALDSQQNITKGLSAFAEGFVPRAAEGLSDQFNTANLDIQAPTADNAERQRIEDALFGRLEPLIARDQDRLNTKLANQGIGLGSEAFSNAQDDFGRQRTDARLATIGQAGNEQAREFGLQQTSFNTGLSNALLNRTQPLNEISALLQGGPSIATPQLQQPAAFGVQTPDALGSFGLQFGGLQNQFNQGQANNRAVIQGLASLGSTAALASDRRVKTAIKRVGTLDSGLNVYTFRYKAGGPVQMGVMAQEVERVNPGAVHDLNGVKHVDYGAL